MSIRVYVAGCSSEVERSERWIKRLRERGIVVTSSWPEVVRIHGANPRSATPTERKRWSEDDELALLTADLVWGLVPPEDQPTRGLWWQLGRSRSHATTITSGDTKQSIYPALGAEYDTDEAAFEAILRLVGTTDRGRLA